MHEVFSHTILVSNGHESVHIFRVLHTKLGEILDIDSNVSPLSDLQPIVDILAEEVPHLLIVQLKVGDSYKKSTIAMIQYNSIGEEYQCLFQDFLQEGANT